MTLRIFRILHYLETTRQGLMVSEIHQKLNDDGFAVDKRTVHRDIELLEQAHIPLDKEGTPPESRWKIAAFAEIKQNIRFSYQEIFALFVARKSLDHLRGTPIFSALDSVFTKIEKVLGKNSEAFADLLSNIEFRPHMTWHTSISPVILDTVYHALEEGHPLQINYRAGAGEHPGQAKQRKVGPECLYFADGGVYLIAIDLEKKGLSIGYSGIIKCVSQNACTKLRPRAPFSVSLMPPFSLADLRKKIACLIIGTSEINLFVLRSN